MIFSEKFRRIKTIGRLNEDRSLFASRDEKENSGETFARMKIATLRM